MSRYQQWFNQRETNRVGVYFTSLYAECSDFSAWTSACAGYLNENENWIHNEAHGGLFGVYLNQDGLPGCSHIRGFFIWRSFDYGIYFQVSMLNFFYFLTLDLKFKGKKQQRPDIQSKMSSLLWSRRLEKDFHSRDQSPRCATWWDHLPFCSWKEGTEVYSVFKIRYM